MSAALFGPMDPTAIDRLRMMSGGAPMLPPGGGGGGGGAPAGPPGDGSGGGGGGGGGGDLASTLFPAPGLEDYLQPPELRSLRALAMMQMGAKLLAGSQGPQGTLNPGRSMSEALDQGPFQEGVQRLMQQRQFEMQYGGYDALRKALSANAPAAGESPLEAMDRYRRAAQQVIQTAPGPVGMQMAKQLTDLAEGMKRSLPDVEKVENVPGDPHGQYAGQNVVQVRDKVSGRLMYEFPYRMNTTPDQQARIELELHNNFDQHMAPLNMAKVAADGYTALQGKSDPVSDMMRLQYARAILGAKSGGEVNPQEGMLLDQILEALGRAPHQLSPESRATLDAQVMAAIPMIRQLANTEHTWTTSRAKAYGLDTANYQNLWLPKAEQKKAPPKPKAGPNTEHVEAAQ